MKLFISSIVTAAAILTGGGLVDSNLKPAAATRAVADEARWFGPFQHEHEARREAERLRRERWRVERVERFDGRWFVFARR